MKKYKFLVFIIPIIFALLSICGESEYSLAAEPSLVGTWIGSAKDYFSDSQGQLTIDITSDTDPYDLGLHDIEGTVTLTGFSLCFTQGVFSSEKGEGRWNESFYTGSITAIGENFSRVHMYFFISSDLQKIQIDFGNIAFEDSNGNYCLFPDDIVLTKQTAEPPPSDQYSDFSANPIIGPAPLTVNFTDQSTGSITFWEWNFGDGSTSTMQNPSHTYIDPGAYTVSLTVTGSGGSDTETKTDFIEVQNVTKAMPWIPLLLLDD